MEWEANDGVRWLLALADRYEQVAQRLRETATLVRDTEAVRAQAEAEGARGEVKLLGATEACRYVLARAQGKAMGSGDVWRAIRAAGVTVRTRSDNPRNIIENSLQAMVRSGQIRRVEGGYVLQE